MQQEKNDQFVDTVVNEVNGYVDNQSWELVKVEDVVKYAEIMPSVWAVAEYVALSSALNAVISTMELMEEFTNR